jgi:hypothetical protein
MPFMPRGEPQSVPDPDGDAYDEMLRRFRARSETGDQVSDDDISGASGDDQLHGGSRDDQLQGGRVSGGIDWRQHPGFVESLVPVWGSAREAAADYQDGNYLGAAINTGLAASDLIPGAFVAKGLEKAGIRTALDVGKSAAWKNVRERMGRAGYFAEDQVGHHWLIPQRAKWVPERIRNNPANIIPMAASMHKRMHGNDRIENLPMFSVGEKLLNGTPTWFKAVTAQTTGNLLGKGANAEANDRGW